jgi:hypothetical protein
MSIENENQDVIDGDVNYETEARNLGWLPKEEFKGDESHWVDAKEFVERGKVLMPILAKNNKRLQRELLTRDAQIGTLTERLDAATVALEKLERHYTEANKRAVETAKRQLKEELRQARSDNDVDAEFEIQEKLSQLNSAPTEAPAKVEVKKSDAPQLSPEFREWNQKNPWFGSDLKKTKEIMRIAEDLRDDGTDLVGIEFMEECAKILESRNKKPDTSPPPSKVEGSVRTPRSSSSGKSFADLPAEAKQACQEDADELVGPGKRYKNLSEWQSAYAKIYFAE